MRRFVELSAPPRGWQRVRSWPLRRTLATFYGAAVALLLTTTYLLTAIGWLPQDPQAMDLSSVNALPSAAHLLGTDNLGRDLLTRIMLGTQAFFLPGLLAVVVSLLGGAVLGTLAGFWPRRFGAFVAVLTQLLESLPKLVLILLVIALFQPNIYLILVVVGLTNVPAVAELLRARIVVLRKKSYIEAATALGLHPARIILKHVLWLHGRGLVLIQATVGMAEAILIETSLSYLGFGVQEPAASWGNMVKAGASSFFAAANKGCFFCGDLWVSTAPALAILLTILGFHLAGDALLERLEERSAA